MDRVAVFVDAGYLFASGSIALCGEKHRRGRLDLDVPNAVAFLKQFAERSSGLPLLRIYWYDGTAIGPTTEHNRLGHTQDVKVRLGFVNSQGEQKGVDSLLVTDMINLARNRAMATAVLITGDEDIRVGVQQAQEFGVRVVLVGIDHDAPSQSVLLLQESDECHRIDVTQLSTFLAIRPEPVTPIVEPDDGKSTPQLRQIADAVWRSLSDGERGCVVSALADDVKASIPRDVDRKLLLALSANLDRDLLKEERESARQAFAEIARQSAPC